MNPLLRMRIDLLVRGRDGMGSEMEMASL